MEIAFMIFGLAFFMFVVWLMTATEKEQYQRRVNEMREFGTELLHRRKDRRKTP